MDKPESLYRYESFSVQSLRNLKARTIYFGSPKSFNDPYDCALRVGVEEPSKEELVTLHRSYLERVGLTAEQRRGIPDNTEDLKSAVLRSARHALDLQVESFVGSKGVSCFSETNDNLLMWAHYGGQYTGFCLGFSTGYEPFTHLLQVKYSDSIPKVNPAKILSGEYEDFLDFFCTKSTPWSYEREWRVLHQEVGTAFTYPEEALTDVYLGPEMCEQSVEIVCLIMKGQSPNVRIWQGARSEDRFEVQFSPVNYKTHVEARELGLR